MTGEGSNLRRVLVFGLLTAWCAACFDVAVSFRYPIPALAPLSALATIVSISFGLWLIPVALAAASAALPIQFLTRKGFERDALWWGLGLVLVLFAGLSTWESLRRVPLRLRMVRELLPTFLIVAWAVIPGYLFSATLFRRLPAIKPRLLLALLAPLCALLLLMGAWTSNGVGAAPSPVSRVATSTRPALPHVVLITVDTLRRDSLSLYDPDAPATPRLEELARDSLVFEQAVAPASWTKPSLASLQSGLSPAVHGVKQIGDRLSDEVDTLADLFTAAGYVTGLIGFNPYLEPTGNLAQGFQHYRGYPRGRLGISLGGKAVYTYDIPVNRDAGDTAGLTDEAVAFIRAHRDDPFFLWLHYYDPHQPYVPPDDYMPEYEAPDPDLEHFHEFRAVRSGHYTLDAATRRWVRDLYDGEVRQADANVGRVLDELKDLGLYDDALVVFTSDHGEEFWEHGGYEHGHSLYDEVLRIPLLIKLPKAARTDRIRQRVPLEAVYSTIVSSSRLATKDGLTREAPLLSAEGWDERDRDFVSEAILYYEAKVALTRNGKKYVRSVVTGEEELFDLERDPGESHSIAEAEPELLAEMRSRLDAHPGVGPGSASGPKSSDEGAGQEIDPNMMRNLKALGYAE